MARLTKAYFRNAKAAERERAEALGLKRFEAYVHPLDKPAVRAYINRKNRQRAEQAS